jgi:hypothetical protein
MSIVVNSDSEAGSTATVLILALFFAALIGIGSWFYNAHHRVELNRLNGDTVAAPAPEAAPPGVPTSR